MFKVKDKVSSKNEWFKAPPLESIELSRKDVGGNFFLRVCSAVNLVSGIAGCLSMIYHGVLVFSESSITTSSTFHQLVLRVYACAFGGLIVLCERESLWFFSKFGMLENWLGRGLFLLFCAALVKTLGCPSQLTATGSTGLHPAFGPASVRLLDGIQSLCFFLLNSLGLLYLTMGVLCIRSIKLREMNQIKKKKQALLQAQRLNEHKTEIENLLKETESKMQIL